MMSRRVALCPVLLSATLAAQNTWIVDPSGTGDFRSLDAAFTAAASGDTLILRGTMPAPSVWLTKNLNFIASGGAVYTALLINAPGPLSFSGGRFEYLLFAGTTASVDGVNGSLRLQSGSTVAARGCTFQLGTYLNSGAAIDTGARAVFDGCSFRGRDAYAAFGVLLGTPGLQVDGRAELRNCTITGGADFLARVSSASGAFVE